MDNWYALLWYSVTLKYDGADRTQPKTVNNIT